MSKGPDQRALSTLSKWENTAYRNAQAQLAITCQEILLQGDVHKGPKWFDGQ